MRIKIFVMMLLIIAACKPLTVEEEHIMSVEIRSQLGDVLLSGNPIWAEVAGFPPAGAINYKILLRTVSTDSALVGSPFVQEQAMNSDDMAIFNIQAFVDQPASYNIEFPAVNKIIAHPLLAFDITIEAGEEYTDSNGDLQTAWSGTTESHRILKGGISRSQYNNFLPYEFYDNWINLGSGAKFLTWTPDKSIISMLQPVKLWYIYPYTTSKTLDVRYNVYYDYDHIVNLYSTVTLDPDKLYELNLSPDLWGVQEELNGRKVKYIEVQLVDSSDLGYSEIRRFDFNLNYYEQNNYIYYKNSIGGVDCLWCTGKKQELFNSETEVADKTEDASFYTNKSQPTKVVTKVNGQRKWKMNTGYKDNKDEIAALRDFALSKQVWLTEGGNLIPVILENNEIILNDIARNLDSLDFTIKEAHTESYY